MVVRGKKLVNLPTLPPPTPCQNTCASAVYVKDEKLEEFDLKRCVFRSGCAYFAIQQITYFSVKRLLHRRSKRNFFARMCQRAKCVSTREYWNVHDENMLSRCYAYTRSCNILEKMWNILHCLEVNSERGAFNRNWNDCGADRIWEMNIDMKKTHHCG